jgi:hypothetical protein
MIPPKLGEVWEPPPSSSQDDDNFETQNSIIVHEQLSYAPIIIIIDGSDY